MPAYTDLTTKTAKTAYIRGKMQDDVQWALKGLLAIYNYQASSEQACGATHEDNGVGFSGADSEILSSFAERVKAGRQLSVDQIPFLHKLMPKYAKQLMRIAENKQ